jgi:Tol biopolymer transport system component
MIKPLLGVWLLTLFLGGPLASARLTATVARAQEPDESPLRNIRQLTFGGQNAEAYFSADGKKLIFQSTRPPFACDQIFSMNIDGSDVRQLSSGAGRTTCGFFFPDRKRFIYASTHLAGQSCPPPADRSRGYVWPIYKSYEIFSAKLDGTGLARLTRNSGYDAEATVSPNGKKVVFTSLRDGDLDVYLMNHDGTGLQRLTNKKGYDGGPFFSWDGRHIVYRAYHPTTAPEISEYEGLLNQELIKPIRAEIFIMRSDGSGKRQVTRNGAANWAPFLHPNNRQIIFSSNIHDPERRTFSLYSINIDGTGLKRLTQGARFDSFPMLSKDGSKLVFASTRNASSATDFNVFVADWADKPLLAAPSPPEKQRSE